MGNGPKLVCGTGTVFKVSRTLLKLETSERSIDGQKI